MIRRDEVNGNLCSFSMSPSGNGFTLLNTLGIMFNFGDANRNLRSEIFGVEMGRDFELAPSNQGTYILTNWGPIHALGQTSLYGAPYFGTVWHPLDFARDMELTPSGKGYYVLDCWGKVHAFGDAVWYGDLHLNSATGMDIEAAPDGKGYLILDQFGFVSGFGSAQEIAESLLPGGVAEATVRNDVHFDGNAVDFELKTDCSTGKIEGWWILGRDGQLLSVGSADSIFNLIHPQGQNMDYQDLEIYIRSRN